MNERSEHPDTIAVLHSTVANQPRANATRIANAVLERVHAGATSAGNGGLATDSRRATDKSVALDLAYDDYCLRVERGESLDIAEFAHRYPEYESSIVRLLEIHRLLSGAELRSSEAIVWPAIGEEFLGFQLCEELGRGGFARVYLAEELDLDNRLVVVKVSALGVDEAQLLARLVHPNIVPIHSIRNDATRGLTLICMPFLGRHTIWDALHSIKSRGLPRSLRDLDDGLKSHDLERSETNQDRGLGATESYTQFVIRTGIALADALATAHDRGICHGDIKPSNVLLTRSLEPMLLDFNLAVRRDAAAGGGGTLPYMAPEQLTAILDAQSRSAVSPQSDIFSLGMVLYELLAGRETFGQLTNAGMPRAELGAELLRRRRQGPAGLRKLNPNVDAELEKIVLGCLAYSANDRPNSAAQLAASLRRTLRPTRRISRWLSRHRRLAQTGCAAAVLSVALAGYGFSTREPEAIRAQHRVEALLDAGNPQEAMAILDKQLVANPKWAAGWILRGRARQQLADFTAANQDFGKAYRLTGQPILLAAEAYGCQQMNEHKQAIALFDEAIKRGVRSAEVQNDLGYSYLQSADFAEASRCLTKSLAENPKLTAALHNRAVAQLKISLSSGIAPPKQARDDIDAAIALGPPSAELYCDAAVLARLPELFGAAPSGEANRYLTKAIEYGLSREACQQNPLLADLLPAHPESEFLGGRVKSSPAVRVIDPVTPETLRGWGGNSPTH